MVSMFIYTPPLFSKPVFPYYQCSDDHVESWPFTIDYNKNVRPTYTFVEPVEGDECPDEITVRMGDGIPSSYVWEVRGTL